MNRILAAILVAACLLLLAVIGREARGRANELRARVRDAETRVWVPRPAVARVLAAGYNEMVADLFWARTLVYYGGGMEEDSTLADVEPLLDAVLALDPHFRRPYWWGAYAVTYRKGAATQEEFRASIEILERALETYPEDYELTWLLGLRYYLDLKGADEAETRKHKELGAAYIERAMRLPDAPPDLPILAASMRTKLGQIDRAAHELREMVLTTSDPEVRAQLEAKYAGLVGEGIQEAVSRAAEEFQTEWKSTLPYVPPTLYVLVGPKPPALSLDEIAAGERFEAQPAQNQ